MAHVFTRTVISVHALTDVRSVPIESASVTNQHVGYDTGTLTHTHIVS